MCARTPQEGSNPNQVNIKVDNTCIQNTSNKINFLIIGAEILSPRKGAHFSTNQIQF